MPLSLYNVYGHGQGLSRSQGNRFSATWHKLEPSWHDSEHGRHRDASRRQFSSPLFLKSSILLLTPFLVCARVGTQCRIYCKYQEKRKSGHRWKSMKLNGKAESKTRIQRRVRINDWQSAKALFIRAEMFLRRREEFPGNTKRRTGT